MENSDKLWIFKSKWVDSAFGGNDGYDDVIDTYYTYDDTVKNFDKVQPGNLIVIEGKKFIEGFARIERIDSILELPKERYRCPICNVAEHYTRKTKSPKYKCWNKHEFDEPVVQHISVDHFTAFYKNTFIRALPGTLTSLSKPYKINPNRHYSIQATRMELMTEQFPNVLERLMLMPVSVSSSTIAKLDDYLPSDQDSRERRVVKSVTRQGQQEFRELLFRSYGIRCMLSGCQVPNAIDASHVCPYRGENDNHPQNGLLLRRDLHALFDANLFGIDPETMKVTLHPSIKDPEYLKFEGARLNFNGGPFAPAKAALLVRWLEFCAYCSSLK